MEFEYEYDTHIMKNTFMARKIKKIPSANKFTSTHSRRCINIFQRIKCLIYGGLGEEVKKRERKLIELNSH